jgi:hypothetical protein
MELVRYLINVDTVSMSYRIVTKSHETDAKVNKEKQREWSLLLVFIIPKSCLLSDLRGP